MSSLSTIRLRRVTTTEIDRVWHVVQEAKERMIQAGKQQWDSTYPLREHIAEDVERGWAYIIEEGGVIQAYGAVSTEGEPTYQVIDGAWLNDVPYVVIHRLAVDNAHVGKGYGEVFLRAVEAWAQKQGIRNIRVDTNHDNHSMQHILRKLHYVYCGIIYLERGGERWAFQKIV